MSVVVVGAGMAGLVAARDLARRGHDVVVVDPAGRAGGCVAAHVVGGMVLDSGAESFATRSSVVADLVTELGLGADMVTPSPGGAWVHLADRTVPLPRTGMLGIPGSPWAADVRRAVGVMGSARASLDRVLPASVGRGSRSLGAMVRSRMGSRVLDRLVAPVVTGVHAAHPDQVDIDVLPGLTTAVAQHGSLGAAVGAMRAAAPAGSAVAGLAGGMNRLVDALVSDVLRSGGRIRLGSRAVGLTVTGDGVRVDLTDGHLDADQVVLAGPGPVTASLLGPLLATRPAIGDLPPTAAVAASPVTLVTLVLDAPELDGSPRGTGVLVAEGVGDVQAKALTHMTAKWAWVAEQAGPGRHVVRLSYGRAGSHTVHHDLGAVALRDASTLLGVPLPAGRLVDVAVTTWATGLPRPRPGHRTAIAGLRAGLAGSGVWVCGAWAAGTGLVSVVQDARAVAASLDAHSHSTSGSPTSAPAPE